MSSRLILEEMTDRAGWWRSTLYQRMPRMMLPAMLQEMAPDICKFPSSDTGPVRYLGTTIQLPTPLEFETATTIEFDSNTDEGKVLLARWNEQKKRLDQKLAAEGNPWTDGIN